MIKKGGRKTIVACAHCGGPCCRTATAKKSRVSTPRPGAAYNWSEAELLFLVENARNQTAAELATQLERTARAVGQKLRLLGITRKKGPWKQGKELTCANPLCGEIFYRRPSEIRSELSYCSNPCATTAKRIVAPSKDELATDYAVGLSTNDLAVKYKISKGTVFHLFTLYGIKGRDLSTALEVFYKTEGGAEAIKKRLDTSTERHGTTSFPNAPGGFFKSGFMEDLGVTVRSGWEAVVLRWLSKHGTKWQYEPQRFYFTGVKRGVLSYLPDIYLPKEDLWVEVKGYLPSRDRTKIRRFKKFFPDDFAKLRVIIKSDKGDTADFFSKMGVPVFAYYQDIIKEV